MSARLRSLFARWGPGSGEDEPDAPLGAPGSGVTFIPAPHTELESMVTAGLPDALHVQGDLDARVGLAVPGGIIVRGSLRVAPGARLDAPVEVMGDVRVGAGATLTRPLLVHGSLYLEEGATVPACRVNGNVHLARRARIDGEVRCAALYLDEEEVEAEVIEVEFVRPARAPDAPRRP